MEKETKQILGLILDKLDSMDNKLENIDSRLTNVETELKDFHQEMKQEIKGLDGKMDIIYNKLNSDINKSKYTLVKEDE